MRHIKKPFIFFLLAVIQCSQLFVCPATVLAERTPVAPRDLPDYQMLESSFIKGADEQKLKDGDLNEYFKFAFRTFFTILVVIAILTFTIGGLQYITSTIPGVKLGSKARMQDAVIGLLIAFCSWLILNTINPDLVNWKLEISPTGQSQPAAGGGSNP